MTQNRKQRRAARKRSKAPGAPKRPEKMTAQERAQALTIGIGQLCERYTQNDYEVAAMALTSAAAVRALAAGDAEEVFVARARTLFQQAAQAIEGEKKSIITNPAAGKIVGPDGSPVA
jgi:hypothetical protein